MKLYFSYDPTKEARFTLDMHVSPDKAHEAVVEALKKWQDEGGVGVPPYFCCGVITHEVLGPDGGGYRIGNELLLD